jgi:hypothetical protein
MAVKVAGRISLVALCIAAATLLAACGSSEQLPEAASRSPIVVSDIASHITQTGTAAATIDPSTVTFKVDNAGILVVKFQLTSTASVPQTIAVRASLYDSSGSIIGDSTMPGATGGAINVDPGSTQDLQLTGNAPDTTIASVTFEVSAQPSPTPTASPTPAAS